MAPPDPEVHNDAKTPTPKRSTPKRQAANNYAAAASPIASARRPKNSRDGTPKTPARTTPVRPRDSENGAGKAAMSPMHGVRSVPADSHHVHPADDASATSSINAGEPGEESPASASWVGRKVDAIFSPVLHLLQGSPEGEEGEELGSLTRTEDSEDTGGELTTKGEAPKANDGSSSAPISDNNADHAYEGRVDSDAAQAAVDGDGDVAMDDYDHYTSTEGNPGEAEAGDQQEGEDDESYADEEEFNPYLFIKCLPPYHRAVPPGWAARPKALPDAASSAPPICLVLDLDETLVHCTVEPVADADMIFPVEFNGVEYRVHVRCRPFLQEFLRAVAKTFEVVIFTASQQVYADKLLDMIDPERTLIKHRMFRDSCLPVEGNFLKDLTVLGRDLSKAVLVDNSPHAFGYQVDNGIPIESWFDDPNDKELLKLEMFLRTLHGADDVREVVRKTFQTHRLVLDA
ncbi:hypothetical protein ACHAXT_005059 [Thalassiosira profunda]